MQQPDMSAFIADIPKTLRWIIPDTIRSEHATNLVVQQQGTEFIFLFFETESVLFTGSVEEQLTAYKELPEVKARCVARIVMSANNTIEGTNNLIESVNRFQMMVQNTKGQENASRETQANASLSTPN